MVVVVVIMIFAVVVVVLVVRVVVVVHVMWGLHQVRVQRSGAPCVGRGGAEASFSVCVRKS